MTRQTFSHTLIIDASAHDIYECLIDPLKISSNIDRITDCTIVSGPSKGKGAVSRWTRDDGSGNLDTWEEEIIDAVQDQEMTFQYRSYLTITGIHQLRPVTGGTEATFTEIHDYEGVDPTACRADVEHVLVALKAFME
jgi:hypothetical protein